MGKSEFILLIPGIIYGVALVDLLKIFRHKNTYWETTAWGIAMIINLIVSWFNLYDKLDMIGSSISLFSVYQLILKNHSCNFKIGVRLTISNLKSVHH